MLRVAALSVVAFAGIIIMTQRGTPQLLLPTEGKHIDAAPQELLPKTLRLSHRCALLLPFYLFFNVVGGTWANFL